MAAPTKVLIVDDDPDNLKMVSRFLTSHGYEVVTSSSPFGVNSLITEERPHVVVLDVTMPALSGEAVAKFLSARPSTDRVPLVFYSAIDDGALASLLDRVPEARGVSKAAGLLALRRTIDAAVGGTARR